MIGIVDYGVGNIFSVKRSLDYLGIESELIGTRDRLLEMEKIILPGVGAFGDAMDMLRKDGMDAAVKEAAENEIPLLGICLGMQLLLDKGYEYGVHEGLGLIPGYVEDMNKLITNHDLDIPQMGWNSLSFPKDKAVSPLLKNIDEGSYVYFVHSYSAVECDESIIATTDYSYPVTAAIGRDNIYGTQFHPEKSGTVGLNILKAFCEH